MTTIGQQLDSVLDAWGELKKTVTQELKEAKDLFKEPDERVVTAPTGEEVAKIYTCYGPDCHQRFRHALTDSATAFKLQLKSAGWTRMANRSGVYYFCPEHAPKDPWPHLSRERITGAIEELQALQFEHAEWLTDTGKQGVSDRLKQLRRMLLDGE